MAKLTDKQIKKIIQDYAESGNLMETARRNGVSDTTVKRHISKNPQALEMIEIKKAQNTKSVLEHMDSQRNLVKQTLDKLLKELSNPDKIANATLQQIATVMGILIDKYTGTESNVPSQIRIELIRRKNNDNNDST